VPNDEPGELPPAPDSWHRQHGGFYFNDWLNVIDGQIKDLDRLFASLGLDLIQRTVDNALCHSFFAGQHHNVHKLSELDTAEFWIGQNVTFGDFATTGHINSFVSFQLNRNL